VEIAEEIQPTAEANTRAANFAMIEDARTATQQLRQRLNPGQQ
jgi:hypothetical protein